MGKAIPDRWLDYSSIGKRIAGTRFIAFKVPLRENINKDVDDEELRLAPRSLMESVPNLGLIVDLTNTNRYYDPQVFEDENVTHQKLCIPGHQTPPRTLAQRFCQYVTKFLEANADNDKLIGVHCTHGVNRTGYLICYYMILKMNISPTLAMQTFADARGHKIERSNYTQSLQDLEKQTETESASSSQHKSKSHGYSEKEAKYFQQQNKQCKVQYENWRIRPQEQQQQQNSYDRRKFTPQQEQQPQRWQHHKGEANYDRQREGGYSYDNQANSSRYQPQRSWQPKQTRRYQSEQDQSYSTRSSNYHPYSRNNNNFNYTDRHNKNYPNCNRDNNYNNRGDTTNKYNNYNNYSNNYSRNNNYDNRTESRTKLNHHRHHE